MAGLGCQFMDGPAQWADSAPVQQVRQVEPQEDNFFPRIISVSVQLLM
jgi:hypothetical protein